MFHIGKDAHTTVKTALTAAVFVLALENCAVIPAGAAEISWRKWDEADAGVEKAAEFTEAEQQKIEQWRQRIAAETEVSGQAETQSEESQEQGTSSETAVSGTETAVETQTEGATESEPEGQTGTQSETQSEAQSETQTEAQSETQSEAQSGEQTETQTVSEYIFPDVDSRYLTEEEVQALTLQEACYAKNEIYARHGRQFMSVELQEYFGEKSWYSGTVASADFQDSVFNEYEQANLALILNWEMTLQSGGYQLDQPGYDIHLVKTGTAQ